MQQDQPISTGEMAICPRCHRLYQYHGLNVCDPCHSEINARIAELEAERLARLEEITRLYEPVPAPRRARLEADGARAVKAEIMQAREAAELAGGGRLWVRLPGADRYHRCTVEARGYNRHGEDQPVILFDAGWGSEELEPGELVKVDTGRIA